MTWSRLGAPQDPINITWNPKRDKPNRSRFAHVVGHPYLLKCLDAEKS